MKLKTLWMLKFEFRVLFICQEILLFSWFIFNHSRMQKAFLAWRPYQKKKTKTKNWGGEHVGLMNAVVAGMSLGWQLWMRAERMFNQRLRGNGDLRLCVRKRKRWRMPGRKSLPMLPVSWSFSGTATKTAYLCRECWGSRFEFSIVRNSSGRVSRIVEIGSRLENLAYVCLAVG